MTKKLWVKIFLRVTAIFAVFVAVLAIANTALLYRFFESREKSLLVAQMENAGELNIDDSDSMSAILNSIAENNNFEIEVYRPTGETLFTTNGGKVMDYFQQDNRDIKMQHINYSVLESKIISNDTVFEKVSDDLTSRIYLLVRRKQDNGVYVEMRIQEAFLKNSVSTANTFIIIVACGCFVTAILWVYAFARKLSKPISEMSDVTKDLSRQEFSRRVSVDSNDEIGQLAVSINHMSNELEAALEGLKEKNARLQDEIDVERQLDVMRRGFVANVSHELKTPISVIQGYAEGLKCNINQGGREQYCDVIIDESQRMNRLVLSLLQLSKYESGQISVTKEKFDIAQMVREYATRIFRDFDGTVNIDLPDSLPVNADPTQVEQVLKCYFENALAHIEPGGIVRLYYEDKDSLVRICVYNSGSHIDDDQLPRIWESFYRGDKSHKREHNRFGLGLSIVRAIARLHGRQCGVYNTAGGVCFWIELQKAVI